MDKKFVKLYLICISLLAGILTHANAANIVYPKSTEVTINSPRTFFIGNESPDTVLKINDEQVEIHPSGGFWHTVNLNEGENIFKIENCNETQIYKITRSVSDTKEVKTPEQIHYKSPKLIVTNEDNTVLRSTPVDYGTNRLQHLPKGIKFTAIGEFGDFYNVQLARDDFAWVSKSSVAEAKENELKPAKIESYTYEEQPDKRIFKIKLSHRVPYVLYDNDGLDLFVYNIQDFPYNKYEFRINKINKMFGFKSYYKPDNELVIEINNPPVIDKTMPLKGIKIALDPGHGGNEYGAIGCLGDKEKDINLDIALKLRDKLKEAGAEVYMTREDDNEISLTDRVNNSNEFGAQIFISIHNNALPDSLADKKMSGSETYYFYPQSRGLAKSILKSLTSEMNLTDNGAKAQSFAVVRNTQSLSVLVEIAYIINPEDNCKLLNEDFQNGTAQAILHGLENYLNDVQ